MKKNIIISILSIVLVIMSFIACDSISNIDAKSDKKMSYSEFTEKILYEKYVESLDNYNNNYRDLGDIAYYSIDTNEYEDRLYYNINVQTYEHGKVFLTKGCISFKDVDNMYHGYKMSE